MCGRLGFGGNLGIAVAISKGCGKGGKNSFVVFPGFPEAGRGNDGLLIASKVHAAMFIVASVQSCSN